MLQWYGAAYTLASAVLLITGARLGDSIRFGGKSSSSASWGFTAASAACAAAPNSGFLITMRVIQGAFGALLIRQGFGIISGRLPRRGGEEGVRGVRAGDRDCCVSFRRILGGALTSGNLSALAGAPCSSSTFRSGSLA